MLEYIEHRRTMILNDMASASVTDAARCQTLVIRLQEFNAMLVGLQRFIESGDMADIQITGMQ